MTRQISDTLLYEGKKFYLEEEILEKYFRAFPEKKPKIVVSYTALWRGYIATFEIREKQLFIKEMEMLTNTKFKTKSVLKEVFPNNKYEWFSGIIELNGKEKDSDDNLYEFLEIYKGNLIKKRIMTYDELQLFKKEQYEYFIMSDDVLPIYEMFRKNNKRITEERMNEIIEEFILFYTREVYAD